MTSTSGLAELVAREMRHAADFAELSESCAGAWPPTLRDILVERDDAAAKRLLTSVSGRSTRIRTERRLPLPHPLDADWRFTRDSANRVLDILIAATPPSRDILLVAMPTVALAAHDRGLSNRIVIASHKNDPVERALRAAMPQARFDVPNVAAAHPFHTVAIDPPWYDDVAATLITTALAKTDVCGRVFVCAPDRFTKPSAARRLTSLTTAPEAMGFSHAAVVGAVRYATPFFEMRCLEAIGMTNVSPIWRTGILLSCTPQRQAPAGGVPPKAAVGDWQELVQGLVRIRFRSVVRREAELPSVTVATSISRSDPLRSFASLWTSGNTTASNVGKIGRDALHTALENAAVGRWEEAFARAVDDERQGIERSVDFT